MCDFERRSGMVQISAKIPKSLKMEYIEKCGKEGRLMRATLALIVERFIEDEFGDLWEEE